MYAGDNKAHDKILPINKIMVTHHPQNNQEGSHQNFSIYYMWTQCQKNMIKVTPKSKVMSNLGDCISSE